METWHISSRKKKKIQTQEGKKKLIFLLKETFFLLPFALGMQPSRARTRTRLDLHSNFRQEKVQLPPSPPHP